MHYALSNKPEMNIVCCPYVLSPKGVQKSKAAVFRLKFRNGSMDVVQECRSYFGVELPSYLIKKNKTIFCLSITVWRICFVFVLLCSKFIFLSIV